VNAAQLADFHRIAGFSSIELAWPAAVADSRQPAAPASKRNASRPRTLCISRQHLSSPALSTLRLAKKATGVVCGLGKRREKVEQSG
jgi:hypothetical protein